MNGKSKDLLQSETTWGGLIVGLQPFLAMAGVEVDAPTWAANLTYIIGMLIGLHGNTTRASTIASVFGVKFKGKS